MNDVFLMHILQPRGYLFHNFGSLFLRHFLSFFDLLEAAIRQQLHNEIQMIFIMKIPVKSSKVTVREVGLQFYLSDNVFLNFSFFYSLF